MPNHFPFFQKAMLALLGNRSLQDGLVAFFEVLREYFPLDGMSFDHFLPEESSLFIHYVVTKNGFNNVKTTLPLTETEADYVRNSEAQMLLLYKDHGSHNDMVSRKHSQILSRYVPYKNRGYMVAILQVDGKVIGHLAIMGQGTECFTETHAQMLQTILPACSLAMFNMLEREDVNLQKQQMQRQRDRLQHELDVFTHTSMVGAQGGLRGVVEQLRQLGDKDTPVLILGETGTGKEVVANAVQRQSVRRDGPFVKVNCGALSDTLLDSELFGHERGAFTGAVATRRGRFEQANGGTLFLDEVGELSPQAQVRLLRVLQDGTFDRIGGVKRITVDVRIIAATNRDLKALCREGRFREDLFHRLHVFPIHMPPLRDRLEDIPLLVRYMTEHTAERLGVPVPSIIMGHMDRLMQYPWPGNVRELENLVERAFIVSSGGPLDIATLLPPVSEPLLHERNGQPINITAQCSAVCGEWVNREYLDTYIEQKLRDMYPTQASQTRAMKPDEEDSMETQIRKALEACNGKVSGPGGAADFLGMNANTLRSRIRKLALNPAHLRRRRLPALLPVEPDISGE